VHYPDRERFCTLAMLAMYRAGRQAEALGVYREARRRLAINHGIEPGPELADMHDRILAADPAILGEPLTDAALRLTIAG
jgi:DNA-binding SARP family transcriptional activator